MHERVGLLEERQSAERIPEPLEIGRADGCHEPRDQRCCREGMSRCASDPGPGKEDRDDWRELRTRRSRQAQSDADRDCSPAADAFARRGKAKHGQRESEHRGFRLPQRLACGAPEAGPESKSGRQQQCPASRQHLARAQKCERHGERDQNRRGQHGHQRRREWRPEIDDPGRHSGHVMTAAISGGTGE